MDTKFEGQHFDEKMLLKKNEHIVSVILRNLGNFLLILTFFIVIAMVIYNFNNSIVIPTILIILPLIIFFIIIKLYYKQTYIIMTNKRIIKSVRNGLFSSHMKELPITSIKQVQQTRNGILGSIFNYGNIMTQGPDEKTSIYFKNIAENKSIVLYISRMIAYIKKEGEECELWPYVSNYKNNN